MIQSDNAEAWESMRNALWPSPEGEHRAEIEKFFEGKTHDPAEVFVAEEQGRLLGFAEVSLRPYAEGCKTSPVGYLEGLYVEAGFRRKGIASALVRAAEDWARSQGCKEFASDTEIENHVSEAMHRTLGFEEVERIICFKKKVHHKK